MKRPLTNLITHDFTTCTLNLGLEKPMLINSTNMSHLAPFSHWSINDKITAWVLTKIFDHSHPGA